MSHAREEQAQVVKDFRRRGHGGARIARGIFLSDGHRGRDAGHLVNVGLLHALQKLARVRRKRFHVAPLPFRVHRVERQARFARAGNARHHRQAVVGNIKIDVLQVVDARSAHSNGVVVGHPRVQG